MVDFDCFFCVLWDREDPNIMQVGFRLYLVPFRGCFSCFVQYLGHFRPGLIHSVIAIVRVCINREIKPALLKRELFVTTVLLKPLEEVLYVRPLTHAGRSPETHVGLVAHAKQ